jgi:hypothetical protein
MRSSRIVALLGSVLAASAASRSAAQHRPIDAKVTVNKTMPGACDRYGRTAVILRFGTWPTGICVISLRVATSTTDTEFDPALAT